MKKRLLLILLPIAIIAIDSSGQVYSDDALYEKGYNEVKKSNWPAAGAFLFAYVQRSPAVFVTHKSYEKQVSQAYAACLKNIENERVGLQKEIQRLNNKIAKLESNNSGLGSTSQGIEVRPEIPNLRKPVERRVQVSTMKVPPTPIKGGWETKLTSSGGSVFTGTLIITTIEDIVSGKLSFPDNTGAKVTGIYDGENLVLIRNSGIKPLQTYTLKKSDNDHFIGTYKNEGQLIDEGTVEFSKRKIKKAAGVAK